MARIAPMRLRNCASSGCVIADHCSSYFFATCCVGIHQKHQMRGLAVDPIIGRRDFNAVVEAQRLRIDVRDHGRCPLHPRHSVPSPEPDSPEADASKPEAFGICRRYFQKSMRARLSIAARTAFQLDDVFRLPELRAIAEAEAFRTERQRCKAWLIDVTIQRDTDHTPRSHPTFRYSVRCTLPSGPFQF